MILWLSFPRLVAMVLRTRASKGMKPTQFRNPDIQVFLPSYAFVGAALQAAMVQLGSCLFMVQCFV